MKNRIRILIRALLVFFTLGMAAEIYVSQEAFARAGAKRSMGRQMPSSQRTAPPPQQYNGAPSQPQKGGFMKGLAGGIAGGFLGSMLFSSLGHAGVGGSGGGGGIGLIEILLLAGLGYLLYRMWKNRQLQTAGGAPSSGLGAGGSTWQKQWAPQAGYGNNTGAFAQSLNPTSPITSEEASDIFFRIQAAWTRRDLGSVRHLLGSDISRTLDDDISVLKRDQRINRLENISIRQVDVRESTQEAGEDLTRVRFVANLLDYTVDESSSKVLEGSDTEPVKFEEEWIFGRSSSNPSEAWKLVGIQQV